MSFVSTDYSEGRLPCPLSAKLYKAQRMNTVFPEELVRLVGKAVMEVRDPSPPKLRYWGCKWHVNERGWLNVEICSVSRTLPYALLYSSEVVWPEHAERKSNCRKMSLTTQALLHLAPSPSPMDVEEEQTEQTANTDEPEEELSIYDVQISIHPAKKLTNKQTINHYNIWFKSCPVLFFLVLAAKWDTYVLRGRPELWVCLLLHLSFLLVSVETGSSLCVRKHLDSAEDLHSPHWWWETKRGGRGRQ